MLYFSERLRPRSADNESDNSDNGKYFFPIVI